MRMKRRNFLGAASSAGLAAAAQPPDLARRSVFELRYIYMRIGSQVQRTSDFLSKYFVPAAQRAGMGPMGFFSPIVGEQSPYILALTSYPSLGQLEAVIGKLESDKEYIAGAKAFNAGEELSYMRMENSLLIAFASMPQAFVPPAESGRAPRVFELRTYESKNSMAGMKKIEMFNQGEIGIFKRLGMTPIFFGQTVVGRSLPNLTYMLAFDDLAHREKAWRAFGSDPEWQKMRAMPGYADAEIVSNISNSLLRPLAFSPIR